MSKFLKKKKPPTLMLTSLLDMFTIILIFLIVSFEAEDYEFKLNSELTLPESSARSSFKPAVNIAITPTEITIERKSVYKLKNGKAQQAHYDAGEIPIVVETLKPHYEAVQSGELEVVLEDEEEDPAIIVVQADRKVDYKTVYLVLRSASVAGFVKYRMAILKK